MNQFKTDIIGNGMPIVLDDFRFSDNIYRKSFEAIITGLYPNCIIHGCNLTDNGNDTATITAGAVALYGEICIVEEHTITYDALKYRFELLEDVDSTGYKLFANGSQHNTYLIRTAHVVESPSSIQNEVLIGSSKILELIQKWNIGVPWANNGVVTTDATGKLIVSGKKTAHNKDFGTGDGEILPIEDGGIGGDGILVLEQARQTTNSINFLIAPYSWQAPSFLNDWTDAGGFFKYRKTKDNYLDINGLIQGFPHSSELVFNLPTGYRPVRKNQSLCYIDAALNSIVSPVDIEPNGDVIITKFVAGVLNEIYLNIRIPLD